MENTPDDERETSAMPQAAGNKDDKYIADVTLVATERYVDVVADKVRERDMPTAPEVPRV